MKKVIKFLLVILLTLILLIGLGIVILDHLASDLCANKVFLEINSPDKKNKAVVFQRDCGATTGFSTQISIISINEELSNNIGNIFVAQGQPATLDIAVKWLDPTIIFIDDINATKISKKLKSYKDITVKYAK